ncbi:uncharacterized protein LOC112044151 [Bicyclus anynana]|uniref:Uncharacterized protein LOC112044151 n=1 Tax=Bicyclus anynana TaxID=110368 RepID=A0ABM3LPZ6_BICAN|nr:uncharacterized protein LOC112044151 [Bicyclus anynana]
MVWIHGGGFISGSGDDNAYGPEYLIRKGVILVTLNYRLEILGFLSLDTEDIPGNAGMKDQVAALRWVKRNIRKFGGDPDNITIFGESAGGASVSFHVVSPMTKGLFKRAIMQSGTVTGWLPRTFRPREKAIRLAQDLGFYSNDLKEIYKFFINQPVENLYGKEVRLSYAASSKESPNFMNLFAIVSETQFGDNERYYYGDAYDLVRNDMHEGVQIINGYTEDEGIIYFSAGVDVERLFDQANKFVELFVPLPFTRETPLTAQMEIGRRFREFYLKNDTASKDNLDDLLRYFNMELFSFSAVSMQKLVAKRVGDRSYLYKFTCKSELNMFSSATGLDGLFNYRPVTAHADDLGYLFPSSTTIDMKSNAFKMIDQLTTLWTNFAKYGDPTPDDSLGAKWLPFTSTNQEYLDIGEILVPKTFPDKEEIDFWESVFQEYLPQYAGASWSCPARSQPGDGHLVVMDVFNWALFFLSKIFAIHVSVNEGILEGDVVRSAYGSPYFSFKGIPYAEPPVGDLRFKAPLPKTPWQGVRSAKQHAPKCYQYELFTNETLPPVGSEDCLYLNIYTPHIAPIKSLPVMVWIHGGGFVSGSGNVDEQNPEFLMRKGVILVTLNYRLEVLGFLSLDTEEIPGNAGMKDQVAALRWIKQNIRKFGGDPDNITIFGESAGGASVSFHLVSPMSRGLFQRAITQSGALTCWWPITFRARDRGVALAKELGCYSTDDRETAACLRAQPYENLISKRIKVTYAQWAKESPNVYFGIVSENQFGDNERFFFGHPYDVLRDGIHEGVQVMNGYTEDEGVMYFTTGVDADSIFDQANKFTEFFVPEPHITNTSLVTQMEIGEKFREFYLGERVASKETLDYMVKYFNMEMFVYGAMALQKIIAKTSDQNHYLYKFTCKSELNIFTQLTGIDYLFDYRPVVAHSDDLPYLFPYTADIDTKSKTFKMVEQVTTLWTNFAKYGDPTPDASLGARWAPYTLQQQQYLDIGEQLLPGAFPDQDQVLFWEDNFREHLPKLVP